MILIFLCLVDDNSVAKIVLYLYIYKYLRRKMHSLMFCNFSRICFTIDNGSIAITKVNNKSLFFIVNNFFDDAKVRLGKSPNNY